MQEPTASVPGGRTQSPRNGGSGGQYGFSVGLVLEGANVDGYARLLWYLGDVIHEPPNGV